MIVYQPASVYLDQHHLKPFATQAAKHLFPKGKVLDSSINAAGAHLLVQTEKELIAMEFYPKELRENAFEEILKTAASLEVERKGRANRSFQETMICLFAHGFSQNLLIRIPTDVPTIRLFEWRLLRSEKDKAVVIRELKNGARPEKSSSEKNGALQIESPSRRSPEDLSTPELIAFARFGIELRERRFQV